MLPVSRGYDGIQEAKSERRLQKDCIAPPLTYCFRYTGAMVVRVVASASLLEALANSFVLPEGFVDDYYGQETSHGSRQRTPKSYRVASTNSTGRPFGMDILDLADRSSSLKDPLM